MEPIIISETIKYSDGTEKVVNFTDPVDQSIPEVPETPEPVPVESESPSEATVPESDIETSVENASEATETAE